MFDRVSLGICSERCHAGNEEKGFKKHFFLPGHWKDPEKNERKVLVTGPVFDAKTGIAVWGRGPVRAYSIQCPQDLASRLAKVAGAEPSGRMRDQELHACGAESKSLASGGPLVKTNVSVTFRIGPLAPVVVAGQAATSCIWWM